jgi:tetratricopeptide (TPR) repeat protein
MQLPHIILFLFLLWLPGRSPEVEWLERRTNLDQDCDLSAIQVSLRNYENSDPAELADRAENLRKYERFERTLAACSSPEGQLLYDYFRGVVRRMNAEGADDPGNLLDEALISLDAAIERDSSRAYLFNERGIIYELQDRLPEAQVDYQQAHNLAPRWALPLTNLGNVLLEETDTVAASDRYKEARRLSNTGDAPDVTYLGLAISLSTQDSSAAFDYLRRVNVSYLKDERKLARARTQYVNGRRREALTLYRELSAADPTSPRLPLILASYDVEMGNYPSALAGYREVLSTPGRGKLERRVYRRLLSLYKTTDRTTQADIRKLIREQRYDKTTRGQAYGIALRVGASMRRTKQQLKRAGRGLSPEQIGKIYQEAVLPLYKDYKFVSAVEVARAGVKRVPDSFTAHATLIEIMMHQARNTTKPNFKKVARAVRMAKKELSPPKWKRLRKRFLCDNPLFYERLKQENALPSEIKNCL